MSGVRWREEGWEHRCDECPSGTRWWPLTDEFWDPKNMARCRACTLEKRRRRDRARPRDSVYMTAYRSLSKDAIALYNRDYYEANREAVLAQVADYQRRNAARIRSRRRIWYEANRETIRAERRAYYRAHADELKAKAKARYYAKKAGTFVPRAVIQSPDEGRRTYNREWMRRKRAEEAAA